MRAGLVLKETGVGLRRNLALTVAVVITVAISLALSGAGLLIRQQINDMKDYWYGKINVSIYLCGKTSLEPTCGGRAVTEAQRQAIQAELQSLPQVKQVYYESSAAAFENYKRLFKNSPDLVKNVDPSALPESFRVKLADPREFGIIAQRFADQPGVQLVQDQGALLKRLFRLLHGFQFAAFVLAGFLVVAAALQLATAIQVAAVSRRRETSIMRLVGASRFYVQLPFLLEGAVLGLLGAIVGGGMLVLFKWAFIDKGLKPNIPSINFIGWSWVQTLVPMLAGGAMLFAVIASFLTISWNMRRS